MLDNIAHNKWLNAAAAAGMTIFAIGLWTGHSNIIWKLLISIAAVFLINDAYKLFKQENQ